MTKPKRQIEVGNRISWVNGSFVGFGTVKEVLSEKCFVVSDKHEEDNVVHRRQIIKVIRKKKKREPRTHYFNEYDAYGIKMCGPYPTKDDADSCADKNRVRCVKFREVLGDE